MDFGGGDGGSSRGLFRYYGHANAYLFNFIIYC